MRMAPRAYARWRPTRLADRAAARLRSPAMGLLDGKNIVITGVLTDASLAYAVARLAQREGAEIVLTGAGRALSLTQRTARKLRRRRSTCSSSTSPCPSTSAAVRDAVAAQVGPRRRRAARHRLRPAVAASATTSWRATWDDVAVAVHISTYSLKALADAFVPLMTDGGAFVGLDFDNRVAWPAYNWMGVAKSALQSVNRYLAKELGPQGSAATWSPPGRCGRWPPRASPASPSSRTSGTSGPRSAGTSTTPSRSPRRASPCCRDWFPATTGEIIHVDGGFHATGAAGRSRRVRSSTA